jgi:Ca-activated chloride channel family protein
MPGPVPATECAPAPHAPAVNVTATTSTEATDSPAQTQFLNALQNGQAHTGKLGVDLAIALDNLRNNSQLDAVKSCRAAGRTCRQVGGGWVDEGFSSKMKTVTVKALSAAYFRLLEKHPTLQEVFRLGTRVVWVTPSGTALVIDPDSGKEKLSDKTIDRLFATK